MSIHREPKSGHGFIYILSHPSMPDVYKIGLTTNSIKQRIQELNTTGVPKPFQVERMFEVEAGCLLRVERLAHEKLKSKNLHHGKEFFEGKLISCVEAVEDSIYEITNEHSEDLIGLAKERAAKEKAYRDAEKTRKEREAQLLQQKLARLTRTNEEVGRQREQYRNKLIKQASVDESLLVRLLLNPFGYVLIAAIFVLLILLSGLSVNWLFVPIVIFIIFRSNKLSESEKLLNQFEDLAVAMFPYKTIDNFEDPGVHSPFIEVNSLAVPPLATEPKESTKELRREALWQMLMRKRQDIIKEIEGGLGQSLIEDKQRRLQSACDVGDHSLIDLDSELGISLKEMRDRRIRTIDEALTRLTEDTYGICAECGVEISERRLDSVPFAKLCLECQSKEELLGKIEREEDRV